ncbi:hypothetical protein Pcinc_008881 [Petrolisthes cinctipes]|uniref:Endonuclease/exonuclease/phosphatase domain-containing protein n=1 Tax=Petrolisthes cinctipes TaxID=88211 RepID=A0AAE1G819_PETCI|nr:hypothetical protein Pcinc_008881 [Petrolisthes cinctipes]
MTLVRTTLKAQVKKILKLNTHRKTPRQTPGKGINMEAGNRIKFLQWNVSGIRAKNHHIRAAAGLDNIDVFLLQETKLPGNSTFKIPGFTAYTTPKEHEGPEGFAILIRDSILSEIVPHPIHCGERVEVLAVRIHLDDCFLYIYHVYRKPGNTAILCLGELFAEASREIILIGGDFNTNHPDFNPRRRADVAGIHIAATLDSTPELSLLNSTEPTYIHGGVLDLTLVITDLIPSKHGNSIQPFPVIILPPSSTSKKLDYLSILHHLQDGTSKGQTGKPLRNISKIGTQLITQILTKASIKQRETWWRPSIRLPGRHAPI